MESVIQNREALATSNARADALAIAEAGYAAIDVCAALRREIHIDDEQLHIAKKAYPLSDRRIFFVGIGKCATRAGRAIESLLGESLTAGIVLDVARASRDGIEKMEILVGTHPLPSEENVKATERILEFLSGRKENDLVIMLISGGGSSLLSLPDAPMTYREESNLFQALTAKGAPIQELNTVRKHTSRARGGALAVAAYPAEVVSLIVSDVSGDDIGAVASGPTVMDVSTVADALAVLKKYDMPATKLTLTESIKDEKFFKRVHNMLFLSGRDALAAMQKEAEARKYAPRIVDPHFSGEARDIGYAVAEKLHAAASKTALLYAGESTVTLGANVGSGGRNQEMALAALATTRNDELLLPFASDGLDNTEYAGGIADEITQRHAREKNVSIEEHLDTHTSRDFFATTGDALMTGPLESNVSDLIIALKA